MSYCRRNGGSYSCHPALCEHTSAPASMTSQPFRYNNHYATEMYSQSSQPYPQSFPPPDARLPGESSFQLYPNSALPPNAPNPYASPFATPKPTPQYSNIPLSRGALPPPPPPWPQTPQDPNQRPTSDLSPRKAPAKRRQKGPAASLTSTNAVLTASLWRTQGPTLGSDCLAAAMHPAASSTPRFVLALNRSLKTTKASATKGASDVYSFLQPARSQGDRELDTSVERRKTCYSHEEAPFVSCRLCSYVGSLF